MVIRHCLTASKASTIVKDSYTPTYPHAHLKNSQRILSSKRGLIRDVRVAANVTDAKCDITPAIAIPIGPDVDRNYVLIVWQITLSSATSHPDITFAIHRLSHELRNSHAMAQN